VGAARAGRSGVFEICVSTQRHGVHISGEVKGFDPLDYMDRKEARRTERFIQFALAAAAGGGGLRAMSPRCQAMWA
jgi:3-oxoacyl-(acyl-carrier-protein) synthase